MAYRVINLTIGGITAEVYTEPLARHLADFRIWHEVPERRAYFRSWGYTGCAISRPATAALDP